MSLPLKHSEIHVHQLLRLGRRRRLNPIVTDSTTGNFSVRRSQLMAGHICDITQTNLRQTFTSELVKLGRACPIPSIESSTSIWSSCVTLPVRDYKKRANRPSTYSAICIRSNSSRSRTSKAFHELLCSPVTDLTWRNSFMVEGHPDYRISFPMSDSVFWSPLLFGAQICEVALRSPFHCILSYHSPRWAGVRPARTQLYIWTSTTPSGGAYPTPVWMRKNNPSAQSPRYDARSRAIPRVILRTTRARPILRGDGAAVAYQYEAHVAAAGGSDSTKAIRCFVQEQQALVEQKRSATMRLVAEGFDKQDVQTSWYDISACEAFHRMPPPGSVESRPLTHRSTRHPSTRRPDTRIARRKEATVSSAPMALRTPVPGSRHTYYILPHTIDAFPPITHINEDSEEPPSPDDPRLAAAPHSWTPQWSLTEPFFSSPGPNTSSLDSTGGNAQRASSKSKIKQQPQLQRSSDGRVRALALCHGRPAESSAAAAVAVLGDRDGGADG
ncbi:hypothetical protein GGX14DRAFT_406531 [Mycena pura]|uniref:Uncharacterized protein n=1 Tax=Mycena pura TaxID=153505 RepID=A0AAD6Y5D8_9AGAR|nr:hypothetical protein GGX14DRAFT_406528 [Mycena pura]KAJ7192276.1 hypothetical protein GGX14DRAFT_406531 [Mycena pura]